VKIGMLSGTKNSVRRRSYICSIFVENHKYRSDISEFKAGLDNAQARVL